jgi:hypothetical protein
MNKMVSELIKIANIAVREMVSNKPAENRSNSTQLITLEIVLFLNRSANRINGKQII